MGNFMMRYKERYLVDENGNRIGVFLDIADYQKLLEELEELEAICAYDAAKESDDEAIPFEVAIAEIEQDPE
ncbi:hypothetical protein MiSe_29090 [Microseira wollei NIES-4236]|uniref:Prevent-host-death protein n=2 Tax=Microseira wollei TaxID=467598 RepID=A0AAV3XDI3_9CYAN|nr:hypothetical protein MiSe_29090 [Microseira wollei NIES-4236]